MKTNQTPYYYIDKEALDDAYGELQKAINHFWPNTIVGYSFKTNSLPWIVTYMKNKGSFAEVVSDDEYNLALYLGYDEQRIIYNGIAKSKETLLSLIKKRGIANIDSSYEIQWLQELPQNMRYKVGIRVNFNLEEYCPGETTCGDEGSRFGFCVENGDFEKTITAILSLGNIDIVGLHMHTSTKSRSLNVYRALATKACQLAIDYNLNLSYIDIGGGFYGGLEGKPNFTNYLQELSTVLKKNYTPENLTLIVEPGVSIIGPYISYVASVVDIKDTSKNRFVITNGSRIHIDTRMVKKEYSLDILYNSHNKRNSISKQIVCGFTCMETDRIVSFVDSAELEIGDLIDFHKVGAYTLSFSPLFIKYFPDVYVKENGKMTLVRKHWNAVDYSQNCMLK